MKKGNQKIICYSCMNNSLYIFSNGILFTSPVIVTFRHGLGLHRDFLPSLFENLTRTPTSTGGVKCVVKYGNVAKLSTNFTTEKELN